MRRPVEPLTATTFPIHVSGRAVDVLHLAADPAVPALNHVVFLHGWGLTPHVYLRGLRLLAAAGHRVTALTLPGFGQSTPLRHHDLSAYADHLTDALDHLTDIGHLPGPADGGFALVGHSFGGGIALRIAAQSSGQVASLTLICPAGGAASPTTTPSRLMSGLLLDAASPWAARAALELGRNLVRHPVAVTTSARTAWSADLLHDAFMVSGHQIETLMSFGESDTVVSRGAFHQHGLPHIGVEVVPGRHSWLLAQPRRFADKVLGHLAQVAQVADDTPVDTPAA